MGNTIAIEQAVERLARTTGFSREYWLDALRELQRSEERRNSKPLTLSELRGLPERGSQGAQGFGAFGAPR